MQFRLGRVLAVAVLCAVVAGCGGSHTSSSITPAGGTLKPQLNGGTGSLAQPTLYVSGRGAVFAYDLTASGDTAPVSKTTGYYYQAGGVNASIAGIATNAPGDLVVLQNYGATTSTSCQLVYIPARTGTSPASASFLNCNNDNGDIQGTGVGVTFTGQQSDGNADDIDVLMSYNALNTVNGCDGSTSPQYEVDRYTVAAGPSLSTNTCETLTGQRDYIAGSTNGAYFVDQTSGGFIERYDVNGTLTNSDAPGSLPAPGPLSVAANLTTSQGYRVVASNSGGVTTIYSFKNNGAAFTFTHALGTFTNTVAALAVDNNGTIYVGVNQGSGVTKVKVYGPSKTQATDPDYILNNPVRRPNPSASPAAVITGIAIAQ
jgi:hypothetical protein